MPAFPDCPPLDCWPALLGDTLAATERESYERHLESCPACQEHLRRLDEKEDDLRRLGRRIGDPSAAATDPTLSQVLGRLHESKAPPRTGPLEPTDLYFLRPAEQSGVLGLLGDYEVLEVIGQGSMGVVLKAFEPALLRMVAIKVMAPALAGSATARRRFTRKAQAAAAVCHDHVIAVHGVCEADGLPYLVMPYVAGESLQDHLDRTGPLEVADIVRIGLQTASGLAAAHAQGLIHRDIKPANLLLENGVARVKITDFGLARMADDVGLTQNGVVAGTPEYMAPEQARGEAVDHRADLFSLGSVLYACCTGSPPFRGVTALAMLRQVSEEKPIPLRSLRADVPAWLEAFIARLMAKDPAERFQSAAEIAQLLEGYLAHLRQPTTVLAPETPSLPGNARPSSAPSTWLRSVRRLSSRAGLSLLALLAILGMGIGFWFRAGVQPANPARPDQSKPQVPVNRDNQRKQDHLVVDLKAEIDKLPPSLSLFGPNLDSVIKVAPQGWRITLPAQRDNTDIVGVQLPRLRGDFAISLGYELLSVGEPWPRLGAGVWIRTWFDTPSFLSAMLSRNNSSYHKPHEQAFAAFKIVKGSDGKEKYLNSVVEKAHRSRGKLRLARIGSQLQYLVGEEGQDYRVIQAVEIGTADVREVRVFCSTMYAPTALDVRWNELDIGADRIDAASEPASESLSLDSFDSAPAEPKLSGKGWLIAAGCLFAAVLLSFFGVWYVVRRHRRASTSASAAPERDEMEKTVPAPAASALGVQCSGCGKKLKVKTTLAGKRVKCPQCGEAVPVPSLKTARM